MSFNIFKAFQIFGILSEWATRALADGKVTLTEAISLVTQLCAVLGIVPELDLPGAEHTNEDVIQTNGTVEQENKETSSIADPNRGPPEDRSPKLTSVKDD